MSGNAGRWVATGALLLVCVGLIAVLIWAHFKGDDRSGLALAGAVVIAALAALRLYLAVAKGK